MVVQRVELEKSRERIRKNRRLFWLITSSVLALLILFYCLYGFTDIFSRIAEKAESSPQPNEWAMFRRDLQHSGNAGAGEAIPAGKLKWTFATGGPVHSSPTVIDGIVYVGSRDSHLYAVDAATGGLVWSFKTGSWVDSSPVVVGGVAYFGCNDGKLYAVDAKTGAELWSFETPYPVRSTPAVADGMVYFGSDDYNVYALEAATGKLAWHKETDNIVSSSPVVSKGVVAVGSVDGMLYTYNAKNGRPRLEYDTITSIICSPAVKDGVVYVADNGGYFYAIDITGKNWLWENKAKFYWSALYFYGVAPKPPPPSGFIWGKSMGFGINAVSSMAITENNAYLGAGNSFYSIDLITHEIVWTFNSEDAVTSSPAVCGRAVIFGGFDGRLYALDITTGEKIWDYVIGDKITASPAVADGTVYITSHDGSLYAIE